MASALAIGINVYHELNTHYIKKNSYLSFAGLFFNISLYGFESREVYRITLGLTEESATVIYDRDERVNLGHIEFGDRQIRVDVLNGSFYSLSNSGTKSLYCYVYNEDGEVIDWNYVQTIQVIPQLTRLVVSQFRTIYWVGQSFTTSDAKIVGYFDDGSSSTITSYETNVKSGTVFTEKCSMAVNIIYRDSYGSVSTTQIIHIYGLENLIVENALTTFNVGDTFKYTNGNLVVKAKFSDGTTVDVSNLVTRSADDLLGTTLTKIEEKQYKITFKDTNVHNTQMTAEVSVTYKVEGMTSLIRSGSSKLKFLAGEHFSFDETITANLSDGTSFEVDKTDCLYDGETWSTFTNKVFTKENVTANRYIVVSYNYNGITCSFNLPIEVVILSSIAFTDNNTYYIGASYPNSVTATATYTDGTTKQVVATVYQVPNTSTQGTKDVAIRYTEAGVIAEYPYSIQVLPKEVVSILSIDTELTKSSYKIGERFSSAGLKLKVKYNDDSEEVVTPTSTNLDGHVFSKNDNTTTALTVSVGTLLNQNISRNITLVKLSSIAFTGNLGGTGANHDEYLGESLFDSSNIKLTLTYDDDSTISNVTPTSITPSNGTKLSQGGEKTVTISYTEGDKTLTLTKTIYVKVQNGIYISGTPKTIFNYGSIYNADDLVVKASYVGNHFADETITDYSLDYAKGTTIAQKSSRLVTISRGVHTTSYTIHVRYLDSITEITNNKVNFFQGDHYEYGTGATITVNYHTTNGTNESSDISFAASGVYVNYNSNIVLSERGTQTVTVRYTDNLMGLSVETYYSIIVAEDTVSSITLDTSALDELEEEDRIGLTKFYKGYTMFYKTSLLGVIANYTSGRTVQLQVSDYFTDMTPGTAFDDTETTSIEVTYQGKSASYEIEVVDHIVVGLEVDSSRVTKSAKVGDQFECDQLVVQAVYNSGHKVVLELGGTNGYSIAPLIGYEFSDADFNAGYKTVTISFETYSQTYNVIVTAPEVDYAVVNVSSINLQPLRNDVFDAGAISLTLHYKNGLVKTLEQTESLTPTAGTFRLDLSPLSLDSSDRIQADLGVKTINVTAYSNYDSSEHVQTSFNLTVLANGSLLSIFIDGSNAKKTYKTGEVFTGEGFVIKAKLQDIEEFQEIQVASNANVMTDPMKGQVIYEAGEIEVSFTYTLNNTIKTATFTITVVPSYSKSTAESDTLKIVKMSSFDTSVLSLSKSGITENEARDLQKNKDGKLWLLLDINDTYIDTDSTSPTYKRRIIKSGYTNLKCYGYVISGSRTTDTDITIDNGKVILFEDYNPVIEGASNITVTFRRTVIGNADKINLCRGIILYGYKTNRNRAFVYGNTKLGNENVDYHTEPINVVQTENYKGLANGDLTYFPDTGYTGIGQNSNKIIGEAILNNGYMIIVKNDSRQEPSIYFRHCEMTPVIKADGSTATDATGSQLYEEQYPVEAGNIGDGCVSQFGIINFYGDTLFMTKNGLKGIDVGTASSLTDDSKYATPRSYLIDRRLIKEDLSKSHLFKFNKYLIISVENTLFISDYDSRDSATYEWFVLNNIDAVVFFEFDEELYFANSKGEICKFNFVDEHKDYTDKTRIFIGAAGLLPIVLQDTDNANKIVFNNKYANSFENGDLLSVDNLYAVIGKFANKESIENKHLTGLQGYIDKEHGYIVLNAGDEVEENGKTVNQNLSELLFNAREVYLDQFSLVSDIGRTVAGVPYKLITKDDEGNDLPLYCFRLQREDGTFADLDNLEIVRICFKVGDKAIITNKEVGDTVMCQLIGDHNRLLDLVQYNAQETGSYKGVITKKENVKSYLVTKPFNFSQPMNLKHIFNWLVVNDTELASHTDLSILFDSNSSLREVLESNPIIRDMQVSESEMDFTKMSLESWTFDVNTLSKYHKTERLIEDITNLAFVFKNFDDTNIVISNLTVEYTVGLTI